MADEFPSNNKMITDSAAKKPFHFSGDGIYHNLTIFAEGIEEATKEWLARRQTIGNSVQAPIDRQSTPTENEETDSAVQ